jgi:hypothetical protein
MTAQLGLIVAAHGRHYLAQSEGTKMAVCHAR